LGLEATAALMTSLLVVAVPSARWGGTGSG